MFNFDAAIEKENNSNAQVAHINPFDPAPLIAKFDEFRAKVSEMITMANAHDVVDDQTNEQAVTMTTQAKALASAIEKKRIDIKKPYLDVTSVLDRESKTIKDGLDVAQKILNGKITPYLQRKEFERQEAERKAREEAARIQRELEAKARKEAEEAARLQYEKDRAERERILAEKQESMDSDRARIAKIEAEEERIAKEEAERIAAEAVKEAVALVPEIVMDTPKDIKTVTGSGSADLKKEWTFEILNIKAMPDEAFAARYAELVKAMTPWVNAQVKAGIRNIQGVRIFEQATLKTRAK